jgi:signal transduction histidine kinase
MYFDARYRNKGDNTWIRGVLPITKSMENIKQLTFILILACPFILLIVCLGGYRIIKKAFNPVKKLSETAHEIEISKNFSRRLYVSDTKDEIYDMSIVLNDMLNSLEQTYNKEKQFSNDVSHELRTPLSVILSESEYGIKYLENLEEARESFNVIHRQSLRMSNMIKNILELSRMDNLNNIEKKISNISFIMEKVMKDYKVICSSKSISLTYSIQAKVDVMINSLLFERLIDNLMSNAIKFTKDKIEVNLIQNKDEIQISIIDNGCGIEESKINNIWQRFYQVNASRNKQENPGIGLGLSFVDKILRIHGWNIKVDSVVNEGSKFTISIRHPFYSRRKDDVPFIKMFVD